MADALREWDLTPLQWALLVYLFDEPGLDQTGLASRLGVDKTNLGLIVDDLEKSGHIERQVHPQDRRVRMLRLSPGGHQLHTSLNAAMRAVQRDILESALTKSEADTLLNLLVRVIQANEKLARPGGGRRRRAIKSVLAPAASAAPASSK